MTLLCKDKSDFVAKEDACQTATQNAECRTVREKRVFERISHKQRDSRQGHLMRFVPLRSLEKNISSLFLRSLNGHWGS